MNDLIALLDTVSDPFGTSTGFTRTATTQNDPRPPIPTWGQLMIHRPKFEQKRESHKLSLGKVI